MPTNPSDVDPGAPRQESAQSSGRRLKWLLAFLAIMVGVAFFPQIQEYIQNRESFSADPGLLAKLGTAPLTSPRATVASTDWPQWRGPNRDGVSDHQAAAHWPATGLPLLWKVPGGPGHSSLAVVHGRVYTLIQDGDDEAALCLDAETGKELWRQRWPTKFTSYGGVGPRSTPAVVDGRVYAVGAGGLFQCLDAASGQVLWRHDLLREFAVANQEHGVSFSPLVEGDLVFAIPGGAGGSVAAFDRRDGRLLWKAADDPAGYSSPVTATIAGKRQLVVLTGVAVKGFALPDGKLLWSHPWPTKEGTNAATPIVVGDYVFVSSSYNKGCALLEIAPDGPDALAARPVYEHNRMRNHFSTCVLLDDHLIGFDETFLVCMELRTGKVQWKQRGFNKGSVLLAGGKLIVLGDNGVLALVEPNPEKYQELARCTISNTICWALPALAGGRLFVRDQESIMCFDLKGSPAADERPKNSRE